MHKGQFQHDQFHGWGHLTFQDVIIFHKKMLTLNFWKSFFGFRISLVELWRMVTLMKEISRMINWSLNLLDSNLDHLGFLDWMDSLKINIEKIVVKSILNNSSWYDGWNRHVSVATVWRRLPFIEFILNWIPPQRFFSNGKLFVPIFSPFGQFPSKKNRIESNDQSSRWDTPQGKIKRIWSDP